MTFYQELQLNQAGSKEVIRNAQGKKEKLRHIGIYLFKVLITLAFCMVFVIGYSKMFGSANSIAGVVVLLCVMVFRFADFGIHAPHGLGSLVLIFGILTIGPRIANIGNTVTGLLVNIGCIFVLMVFGCHNVMMANHSTLVLGYLLLYGYDVSGTAYLLRVAAMAFGAVLTGIVFYRNHHHVKYKRRFRSLFEEFDFHSSRTKWQLSVTLGVSTVIFFGESLGLPRSMWAGIAAMSVMLPFHQDLKERVKGRIPGNLGGAILFLILYLALPKSLHPYIGVLGGIGVGFSATYRWQVVFNSLGAISIAVGILGFPGAIFFRIFHNIFGAVYGLVFCKGFEAALNRFHTSIPAQSAE